MKIRVGRINCNSPLLSLGYADILRMAANLIIECKIPLV